MDNDVLKSLTQMTEEIYIGLAKIQSSQMQDQLIEYHEFIEHKIGELISKMSMITSGEIMQEQRRKIQVLSDDFSALKNQIGSKYKIYLRGCGKAGKSTLLNALLSIDEDTGSRMGRVPMTFTIDTYTDELDLNKAEVKKIDFNGNRTSRIVSKNEAIEMESTEERNFEKSKNKCKELIDTIIKNIYLEDERKDLEKDIYKKNLLKTTIREIRWGIGANEFFHNCVLIDTPGLSQELRFTNVIEDIKNYEVDGIIWVISTDTLAKAEVIQAYEKEFEEMKSVYADKKVVVVINMYGGENQYKYGNELWKRVEKRAHKIYCEKYGFSEIICVNAKLAYDGNLYQDRKKIDDSNIAILRKKINEMFIEKSSEEYQEFKLKKMTSFLNNFNKDVAELLSLLQEKVAQYDDIETKIINQTTYSEQLVQKKKDEIINAHLAIVKNRIDMNITQIKNLDNESDTSRNNFIKNEIMSGDVLKKNMNIAIDLCLDGIFNKFKQQQLQSVISDFNTQEYALQNFQKAIGNISMKKANRDITISNPNDMGSEIFNIIKDIFGKSSFFTNIAKGIRDSIKSPQDRIYKNLSDDIRSWASAIDLTEEIDGYEKQCYEILEKSMESTCGKYDDICNLCEFINSFINNMPQMTWENIGLFDILGEVENV